MATVAHAPVATDALDLIDGVVYADAFDSAASFAELRRYARVPIGVDELRERLDDPTFVSLLRERRGLYCLVGREALLEGRVEAVQRARQLEDRAIRVARRLRHVPFVRGLILTGSAAAGAAKRGADVDLLVIVEDGRLSVVFALLGSVSRLLSRRLFCPNHYLALGHLELPRRDLYVAREVAQAKRLTGPANLAAANAWIAGLLPNAVADATAPPPLRAGGVLQRVLELPLRGRVGDRLERSLRRLALTRLVAHHRLWATGVPAEAVERLETGAELRFHAQPTARSALDRYEELRAELAERLTRQPT